MASNHCIWDSWATHGWYLIIGRLAPVMSVLTSMMSWRPSLVVPWFAHWHFQRQGFSFDDQLSLQSTQQAFSAMWKSVSGLSKYLEIYAYSNMFAKPGLMATTLLILALPSVWSLWLIPIPMLVYSLNWWLHSWASLDLLQPLTPRPLMNSPQPSLRMCAMHGIQIVNASHSIPEDTTFDCNLQVME